MIDGDKITERLFDGLAYDYVNKIRHLYHPDDAFTLDIAFNERTKDMAGFRIPVVITVYADKSFTFITKQPPATDLIKKAAGITSGSSNPLKNKVGTLTKAQILEIVETKIVDLNTNDKEAAAKIIAGSARSIGLNIVD